MITTIKRLNIYIFFWFIFFGILSANAQTTKVNELLGMLNSNNPDSVQISILRRLSSAYSAVDPVKKFYYANEYRLIGEKNGIDSVVANAYLDMGISYGIRGKLDSSLYYFKLGFEKSKQSNYTLGIARSYANIGFAYDRLERKKDAVKNYEESLKIYRKVNHLKGISQNIINLGSIYYDLGEYKIADNYFKEYFEYVKGTKNNDIGLGNALFSLGNSNLKLDNLDVSLAYYKRSLAIRSKIGDISGIALTNWGLGQVYLKKKEYTNALKYLKVALSANSQVKNPYQEALMLITTSRAYLGLKDFKEAEKFADMALLKAKESNSKGLVTQALAVQIDIKTAENQFAKALQLQSDYISIKDSVDKSNSKKDVFINDINRISSDNKKLEKDNKSIIAQNADYTVVISVISLLLIIVAISLILYYIRHAEKKASNILLQNQKQEIAEVNEELTRQMNIVSAQNIELEKLNNVKNKFFSIVSHDLRGPINNLKMLFELYHKGILDQNELNSLLLKLEDNIYSTASFLDNLLEWAKSQLEGVTISPINVSLQQVVLENIKLVDSQIKFKELNVESKIDDELTAFVDPNIIHIVVRNLLSNAIKFCSKGDQIIFEAKINLDHVLFSIRDTGPGISHEQQQNLFNLAYNNSLGSSNEKGYQIGLVLCKDMITQSGGTINVESKLNEGTLFQISLPTNG